MCQPRPRQILHSLPSAYNCVSPRRAPASSSRRGSPRWRARPSGFRSEPKREFLSSPNPTQSVPSNESGAHSRLISFAQSPMQMNICPHSAGVHKHLRHSPGSAEKNPARIADLPRLHRARLPGGHGLALPALLTATPGPLGINDYEQRHAVRANLCYCHVVAAVSGCAPRSSLWTPRPTPWWCP
jgi:hypothetical protein